MHTHKVYCFGLLGVKFWLRGSRESLKLGVRIRGTPGDIDPLNKAPFKRAISRVKKGPLLSGLPSTT